MSRVDYHLRHSVLGLLGSFWSRVVSRDTRPQARAVATLSANAQGLDWLETPSRKLLSEKSAPVENLTVPYLDGDFVYIGPTLTDFWRSKFDLPDGQSFSITRMNLSDATPSSVLLVSAAGRPLSSSADSLLTVRADVEGFTGSDPLYVLPMPPGVTPTVIATRIPDKVLVSGIDFEVGDGFVIMRESPGIMFRDGGITVVTGHRTLPLPYNYTMQINGDAHGHGFVAALYRGSWSKTAFERAAAQASGLLVLEQDDTLLTRQQLTATSARYVFLHAGPVVVDYPHFRLTPGKDYAKGYVVSAGFRVVGPSDPGWFRRAAGDRTCNLSGALPVDGLYLPPQDVYVGYEEVSGSGSPHAQIHLTGHPVDLRRWWLMQEHHEILHGEFYGDTLGLEESAPSRMVDFHQVVEDFYGARLLVVIPSLLPASVEFGERLREFVTREKPMGSAAVILEDPPSTLYLNDLWLEGEPLWLNGSPLQLNDPPA